jgi:AraC-like DNA-binding protein
MVERHEGATGDGRSPLSTHALCRTSDLDVFREQLCTTFYPARVDTLRRESRLEGSWLSAVRLTHLTIGAVRFGAETAVEPGRLGSYHVNVTLAGQVDSVCGANRVATSPSRAAVFTPEARTVLPRWSADATQLCIKIRRASLEAELTSLLGRSAKSWVDFQIGFDLATQGGQTWLATLRFLLTELDRPGGLIATSAAHCEHLERLLISGLILAQPNSHTAELARPEPPVRPRTVDRVVALIQEHADRPLTLTDLADHAGVGARRLQQGFREHVGMSPMEYLRRTRLQRARRDLLHTEDTVTDIALRWGFVHPGRFARHYHEQFGVRPSETRQR